MASTETIRIKGLKEFGRAMRDADSETKKTVRETLKKVGEPVRAEARTLFSRYDVRSASKFRVRVWGRGYGVFVEQTMRKTTGRRPDYGELQMRRGLLPALESKSSRIESEFEHALDELVRRLG